MSSRLRVLNPIRAAQSLALAGILAVGLAPAASAAPGPLYLNPAASVADRVNDLMSRMTLDDKAGQMTMAEKLGINPEQTRLARVGSVLSGGGSAPTPNTPTAWADMVDAYQKGALGTPLQIPIFYGADTVHGNNNAYGATIFPHNIGLGAAHDPQLVQQIGAITAEESAATGINWGFAPCVCVARDDRWGREYESYGELPANAIQNTSIITGMQGTTLTSSSRIMATAKHFIADGGTDKGVNEGDATLTDQQLRQLYLPPFQVAVARGVGSVMISYSSVNGVKDHGNKYLITDLLKGELHFSGIVVTDFNGIDQIDGQPDFTAAEVDTAVNAGIDEFMVPYEYARFIPTLIDEVNAGHIPMARIDDAVRRILTKKFQMGLFEHPYVDRSLINGFGSPAHHAVARQATRESQVLLKNDGVLPLAKNNNKIFVAGKNADDIGNQSGGWTLSWQGQSGQHVIPGTTILDGLRADAGPGTTVTYDREGGTIDKSYKVAVAVVGETPYAESAGDRPNGFGLDADDLATIAKLKASGVPLVVVTVSGRVLDLSAQLPQFDGLLAAWLPGSEGIGVADVLYGDYNPTGKLTFTWPKSAAQEPINVGDGQQALFPYGYGLSYNSYGGHR